ncbi:agmatine:putrescine antiporter (APC superfamily) [Lacrimispora xylanisolvens]|uniref:Agmatine:putrescine antiporter (APC superfamily) n=1 Tax=Lacrimispora xylanisolvens TaxID=384636 RepID=A0A2S6HPU3_9FIRM|nr:APC family permease [Hungatella xylanolytica]MBE5987307.1 APC family permease [Paenibacillaceae bacterium]PPK79460.1 agmatine:putrescine antiporter (APC superfamily) [Hungatella xylanolytica]
MSEAPKKKFRLIDAIMTVICVVFVAEAAAPVAAIGNSQYFWWIFLLITFLLPYGLISSELGTTYEGDGGMYDWVSKAFGNKWGGRVSWYYWINFPLWMASLALMFPNVISLLTGTEMGLVPSLLIELAFVWIIVLISFNSICDSAWILNGAAAIKILIAVTLGILGIYGAVTHGVANEYTLSSMLPKFDLNSLSYISVILFNCLGFEVVCTFAGDMENPKKQIPQSIIAGGLVIAAIYIFMAFGIGVAIPSDQISTSTGLVASVQILTGSTRGVIVIAVAIGFLLTLFGNMISWSLGVNNVAAYSAENGDMPGVFKIRSKKTNMPIGSAVMNGLVASLVLIIAPFMPNEDLFWSFFALNLVMFLLSYLPVFPAFIKLRKTDADTERPFKVPGSPLFLKILASLPMILIVIALIFTAIPLSFDAETLSSKLPITIGAVIFIIIGEVIVNRKRDK